jgi:hypothetical protein
MQLKQIKAKTTEQKAALAHHKVIRAVLSAKL